MAIKCISTQLVGSLSSYIFIDCIAHCYNGIADGMANSCILIMQHQSTFHSDHDQNIYHQLFPAASSTYARLFILKPSVVVRKIDVFI